MLGGSRSNNVLLTQMKSELREREKENIEARCEVVNREINKAVKAVFANLNMMEAYPKESSCLVTIMSQDYTEHINDWKGLSMANKARKIPEELKEYRRGALNWANGRRSMILATRVFPQFIGQSTQYCVNVAWKLFSSDRERFNLFARLCQAAVISSILNSNVQLNQRSAETPLICQNSVTKHGFDEVLKQFLPPEFLAEIPEESLDEEEKEGSTSENLQTASDRRKHSQAQRSNVFNAFQKAFTDLYSSYLGEYRRRYVPAESPKTNQPPQLALITFSNLTDQINQQLHLCSEEELTFFKGRAELIQRKIQEEVNRRNCQNNVITNPRENCSNTRLPLYDERLYGMCVNNSVPQRNALTVDESYFGLPPANTVAIFPNGANIVPTNNVQMGGHYMPLPSLSTNQAETTQSRSPLKRKLSFDHYQNEDFAPSNKRPRYDNNNNDHADTLSASFSSSISSDELELERDWSRPDPLSPNFTTEMSLEFQ